MSPLRLLKPSSAIFFGMVGEIDMLRYGLYRIHRKVQIKSQEPLGHSLDIQISHCDESQLLLLLSESGAMQPRPKKDRFHLTIDVSVQEPPLDKSYLQQPRLFKLKA